MKITIEYCTAWNYQPQAASLADDIYDKFEFKAELLKSGGGAFEVAIDGDLVYSKLQTGRFPEHSEIFDSIKKKAV